MSAGALATARSIIRSTAKASANGCTAPTAAEQAQRRQDAEPDQHARAGTSRRRSRSAPNAAKAETASATRKNAMPGARTFFM